MRSLRVLFLILALAFSFAAVDGGLASDAMAQTCNTQNGQCTNDSQCSIYCCTWYGCDPSQPPFCSFFPGRTCGHCFC